MARAVGNGLRYFPKDVDYYMDDRIMDLLDAYGPLGQTVYDVMLTMVYREGYYLEMAPDRLARQIIRWIGSGWVESREKVVEVLGFIAEVGLVDKALYRQGIITSAAIQRRYDEVAARRKTDRSKYWLLEAEPAAETETIAAESAGCAAECVPNAAECAPNAPSAVPSAAETPLFAAESAQSKEKETRGNKTKAKETKQKESSQKRGRGKKRARACRRRAFPPLPRRDMGIIRMFYCRMTNTPPSNRSWGGLCPSILISCQLIWRPRAGTTPATGQRYANGLPMTASPGRSPARPISRATISRPLNRAGSTCPTCRTGRRTGKRRPGNGPSPRAPAQSRYWIAEPRTPEPV